MSARNELARAVDSAHEEEVPVADFLFALGYRKPEVIVEWGAAHAHNGEIHNVYRTQGEAQRFVDIMADVDHAMIVKRREHTPATWTAWELVP